MTPTWTPERVEQLRSKVADGWTDRELAEHFDRNRSAIVYARNLHGIATSRKVGVNNLHRQIPDDFDEVAATMPIERCARHYGASPGTVRKWYRLREIEPAQRAYKPRPVRTQPFRISGFTPPTPQPQRDPTQAGRAQSYLQRLGPVFRARTLSPDAPEGQWVVFGRRMEEDAMVEMAVARGFG